VGASYRVDVLSSASADVVSEASPPFRETRHAVGVEGGYAMGPYSAQLAANVASESDLLARGIALVLRAEVMDGAVTPEVGYGYTRDTIGRANTSFDVWSSVLETHEFRAGAQIVLDDASLLVLGATLDLERGDQSNPYRVVPMFDPAAVVPDGASIADVNRLRLAVRPLEQLPTSRDRYALAARYARRFEDATLRIEERAYVDTWAIVASTTDARFLVDASPRVRVGPHARINVQTAANFFARTYTSTSTPSGAVVFPAFRTTDRELAGGVGLALGGSARYALSEPDAALQAGLTFALDALYNKYFDSLLLDHRFALYGTLGFDVEVR
jgi:hypothetical protein